MGKWSHLKGKFPSEEKPQAFREMVDALKPKFAQFALDQLVAAYDALEDVRDAIKAELAKKTAEQEALEAIIIQRLESTGEALVRFEDAGTISLLDQPQIAVTDPAAFRAWVEANAPELLQIYAQTRDKIAKDRLDANEPLPPGLEVKAVRTTLGRRRGTV